MSCSVKLSCTEKLEINSNDIKGCEMTKKNCVCAFSVFGMSVYLVCVLSKYLLPLWTKFLPNQDSAHGPRARPIHMSAFV